MHFLVCDASWQTGSFIILYQGFLCEECHGKAYHENPEKLKQHNIGTSPNFAQKLHLH